MCLIVNIFSRKAVNFFDIQRKPLSAPQPEWSILSVPLATVIFRYTEVILRAIHDECLIIYMTARERGHHFLHSG